MTRTYEWATLYKQNQTGNTQQWTLVAFQEQGAGGDDVAYVQTTYGVVDGKLVTTKPTAHRPKNVGRKNETSAWEQAMLHGTRKWTNKQEKEGYVTGKQSNDGPASRTRSRSPKAQKGVDVRADKRPMLAKVVDVKKPKLVFPMIAQPKLDGVRCITYFDKSSNDIVFLSRKMVQYTPFPALSRELRAVFALFPDAVLDGEIGDFTSPPAIPFEKVTGLVRKKTHVDERDLLTYYVYDVIDTEQGYESRYNPIQHAIHKLRSKGTLSLIHATPYEFVSTMKQMVQRFKEWSVDYEGIMLRDPTMGYQTGKRNKSLWKYKSFMDEEFEIVGFKEGEGQEKGCVVWECITDEGRTFWVRPKGDRATRQALFEEGKKYVGDKLTVQFQEWTLDKIPRFPVGIAIRNYE